MTCYQPFQNLYPLSLLAKSIERQYRGGLQVYDGSVTWSVYLEVGGLIHATNSMEPFERLDRHLCNLTPQVPTTVMRGQIRWLFGGSQNDPSDRFSDYQAICWLVQNHYLNTEQAAQLVEAIAKEAINTLLPVREGTYQFIELPKIAQLPKFCRLNLNNLVKQVSERPKPTTGLDLKSPSRASFASPQVFLEPNRLSPPNPTSSVSPSVSPPQPKPAPPSPVRRNPHHPRVREKRQVPQAFTKLLVLTTIPVSFERLAPFSTKENFQS